MFIPDHDLDFLLILDPGVIKAPDPGSAALEYITGKAYMTWKGRYEVPNFKDQQGNGLFHVQFYEERLTWHTSGQDEDD